LVVRCRQEGFTWLTLGLAEGHVSHRSGATLPEHPGACPACGGTALIKSGHACGRQRWRCQGCGPQFTRTEPRGKPAAMKREAVSLYGTGLPLNAIGQRLGVSAQSVMRGVRGPARDHRPRPEPTGRAVVVEIDEMGHFVEQRPASFGSGRPSRARPAG
jgi:transposase-like protein